ncbi:MAG: hypothetical protein H6621_09110 [Halobacteriovoraceae bacterium]|nr:hypothetical protein [Halobacteriovoraceae bacterium]MCB9095213.1 hypothetical protein [Halobacteriovoraceae bacterium]
MKVLEKHAKTLNLLIFFLGLFFSILFANNMIIDNDVAQMYHKGCLFAQHNVLTPYGNASSAGMGHLPGYISTLVIGIPLKIWDNPLSPLFFLLSLHLVSLGMLLNILKNNYHPIAVTFYILFFWLAPWRTSETFLWNPAFMVFATTLHFWSAYKMRDKKSFLMTFLHLFSIYFAFQLHNSSLVLFLMTIFLFLRGQIKVSYLSIVTFGILAIATLIPYLMHALEHPEVAPIIRESDAFYGRGIIYIFPLIKGLSYWIRYTTTILPRHLFKHMEFSWITVMSIRQVITFLWPVLKFGSVLITLVLSIWLNFKFFKREFKTLKFLKYPTAILPNSRAWIRQYCLVCFAGVFCSAALSPIDLIHWHLLLVLPIACITFIDPLLDIPKLQKYLNLPVVMFFIFMFSTYNFLGAQGSLKHSTNYSLQEDYLNRFILSGKCQVH